MCKAQLQGTSLLIIMKVPTPAKVQYIPSHGWSILRHAPVAPSVQCCVEYRLGLRKLFRVPNLVCIYVASRLHSHSLRGILCVPGLYCMGLPKDPKKSTPCGSPDQCRGRVDPCTRNRLGLGMSYRYQPCALPAPEHLAKLKEQIILKFGKLSRHGQ